MEGAHSSHPTCASHARSSSASSSPSRGWRSREAYEEYAREFHNRFRAAKEYRYAEEPRQVVGMGLLIAFLIAVAAFRPSPRTVSEGVRMGLVATFGTLLVYSFLQSRDGLIVRPHPGVWRLVHGAGLLHLLCMALLVALNPTQGRQLVGLVFPEVEKLREDTAFGNTCDLQCEFSWRTLGIQMRKQWFPAHVLGWFGKMCIFRDWTFCLVLSIAFEFAELSFQWLIPEFQECWWDSLILDVLLSNTIGMLIGVAALKASNSFGYDWMHSEGGDDSEEEEDDENEEETTKEALCDKRKRRRQSAIRRVAMKFTPFTWSGYHWAFFRSKIRFLEAATLLVLGLIAELNVFFIMYALDLPAPHYYHTVRICLLGALGVSAVCEVYHYMSQTGPRRRIGHNAWLLAAITLVETVVAIKYGTTRFTRLVPNAGVVIPWFSSLSLFSFWCFCHFTVVGHERLDVSVDVWHTIVDRSKSPEDPSDSPLTAGGGGGEESKENNQPTAQYEEIRNGGCSWIDDMHRRRRGGGGRVETSGEEEDHNGLRRRTTLVDQREGVREGEGDENEGTMVMQEEGSEKNEGKGAIAASNVGILTDFLRRRRQQWGKLFDVAVKVVDYPALICFVPLVALANNYKYT